MYLELKLQEDALYASSVSSATLHSEDTNIRSNVLGSLKIRTKERVRRNVKRKAVWPTEVQS